MRTAWAVVLIALAARAPAAEVAGTIAAKSPTGKMIEAGYVGIDLSGKQVVNMVGMTIGPAAAKASSTTWKPRNTSVSWDPAKGCAFKHVELPAGTYIFFAKLIDKRNGKETAILTDWQQVKLPSRTTKLKLGLTLSPAHCGSLKVSAPGRPGTFGVVATPADEKEREAIQMDGSSFGPGVEADLGPHGVRLDGLRAGTYRLRLREVHRQKAGNSGWFATYNDIGAWTVRVRAGKVTEFQTPSRK